MKGMAKVLAKQGMDDKEDAPHHQLVRNRDAEMADVVSAWSSPSPIAVFHCLLPNLTEYGHN